MNKRRCVILSGAGATIPWGTPSTDDLTDLLRNNSIFTNDKGETIGEYLYSVLLLQKDRERRYNKPNFETILYFVEMIYEYKKSPYDMPESFFRLNDFFDLSKDINDKLVIFETANPNLYSNQKDNHKVYIDTSFGKHRFVAEKYFYSELYWHFIFLIKNEVEKSELVKTDKFDHLNERLNHFFNTLKKDDSIIRLYTLNYDYLVSNISDVNFFDGYDSATGEIEIKRIIEDNEVDCYYHLHGSFKVNLEGKKLSTYVRSRIQFSSTRNDFISTNIISGFNKTDRLFSDSYFYFYHKLIEDCCDAELIIVIGYSFNDLHVNAALKTAMNRRKAEFIFVDKCSKEIFSWKCINVDSNNDYRLLELINEPNTYRATDEAPKAKAFLNGFAEFLEIEWKDIYKKVWC